MRRDLDQTWARFDIVRKLDQKVAQQSIEEGYARLDALNRIGNTVFALDLQQFDNYAALAARAFPAYLECAMVRLGAI